MKWILPSTTFKIKGKTIDNLTLTVYCWKQESLEIFAKKESLEIIFLNYDSSDSRNLTSLEETFNSKLRWVSMIIFPTINDEKWF